MGHVISRAPQCYWRYNRQFDDASWFKGGDAAITPNADTDPEGGNTADLLEASDGFANRLAQTAQVLLYGTNAHGVFVKKDATSNTNNIISDDLSEAEKGHIADIASETKYKQSWDEIIW